MIPTGYNDINKIMTKVIVQIPCLNEEKTLPLVLESIPRSIKGVAKLEILIINDGSTDKTVEVAKKFGVTHFVNHSQRMGLARSFHDGVHRALELGADIVVNTDGDNQYPQAKIGELIKPILEGRADIVIGDRQTQTVKEFSAGKKALQRWGSRVVSRAAGAPIPDAVSGFRAYSKRALLRLNTISRFSYTTETIIQAGNKQLAIVSVPIKTNGKLRPSRLFKSNTQHVTRTGMAITRAFLMYRPYVLFLTLALLLFTAGAVPFANYLVLYFHGHQTGHLHSLLVGAVLLLSAFLSIVLGIVADLIRINRILLEDALEQIKILRFGASK